MIAPVMAHVSRRRKRVFVIPGGQVSEIHLNIERILKNI